MTSESSDKKTAPSPSPSSSSTADSYIGSVISLTSKFEIRYEGVLYYLNPQDSTLGLKNVKSYGTEGRKKDGPQIPPSDKVYEYILFRGSDIKDLQVKSSPPSQVEEPMHNDPAIIQSQCATGPSTLSKPMAVSGTEFSTYMEATAPNMGSYPSVLLSQQSGAQVAAHGPSQTPLNTNFSSYAMPMPWKGYSGAMSGNPYSQQHQTPSANAGISTVQNFIEASPLQASTTIPLTNSSISLPLVPSLTASNISSLMPEQLSMQPTNLPSLSTNSALSFPPGILNTNAINMSALPSLVQNVNKSDAINIGKVLSDPVTLHAAESMLSSTSSLVDSSSGTLLKQSPILFTPDQLSQPRLPEIVPTQSMLPVQKDMTFLNSVSSNSLSSIVTPVTQAPLLPLQPPRQEFTEEFDFEAMNEKFNKDELWGNLGKAKQRDMDSIHHSTSVCQTSGDEEGDGSATQADSKPAYNKDEFFDSISCNTTGRRDRNGQNRFSERMKMDTETFGQFQQRTHPVYGGYRAARGMNRNPYSWGRRGGYMRQ